MAKLIVTLEIDVVAYDEVQQAAWCKLMGTDDGLADMILEMKTEGEAQQIAGIVADGVYVGCQMNGEAWAASDILAHVTDATVIAAAWKDPVE